MILCFSRGIVRIQALTVVAAVVLGQFAPSTANAFAHWAQAKSPQSAPSKPTQSAPTGKSVARVLQTTITTGQLEPDDNTKKAAQQQLKGDNYKKWQENYRYLKLAYAISEPLLEQFSNERKISVAGNEVDTFFDYSDRARKMQVQQLQQALTQLNAQMQSGKLSAAEKQQGTALKQQFERDLSAMSKPLSKPTAQERDAAEKVIRKWKLDQTLYKQYGGQVIMRPTTPMDPVAAYKKFFEDKEKQKVFEITDGTYKKKFWEALTPAKDAMTIPADKVDFSKPWWILLVEKGQAAMNQKK